MGADMSEHDSHVAHHFDTEKQQFESGKLGMWVFLVTEILLFGGLFCWYAVARANHPVLFAYGHHFLDKNMGAVNTLVLIFSSLTMALAVRNAQIGNRKGTVLMLAITLLCACGFLGIKAVEYNAKWKHGLLWGTKFAPHEEAPPAEAPPAEAPPAEAAEEAAGGAKKVGEEASVIAPAAIGPEGLAPAGGEGEVVAPDEMPKNLHQFFGIYFVMTGLHGLHVLAGMAVIIWLLLRARRGDFSPRYFTPVDLGGLYWHVVDVVWIFLFPLLYLIA